MLIPAHASNLCDVATNGTGKANAGFLEGTKFD